MDRLRTLTSDILRVANECISGAREQLAYFGGQLPVAPVGTIHRAERRLNAATLSLATICPRRIQPLHARIEQQQSTAIGPDLKPSSKSLMPFHLKRHSVEDIQSLHAEEKSSQIPRLYTMATRL